MCSSDLLGHEQSSKFNVGFDATLFGSLNISADYYYQHRYNIWYSTAGSYSGVFGLDAPYENVGVINQKGFEVSADYSKKLNKDLTISLGASMTLNKTIVEERSEEHTSELQSRFDLVCRLLLEKKKKKKEEKKKIRDENRV